MPFVVTLKFYNHPNDNKVQGVFSTLDKAKRYVAAEKKRDDRLYSTKDWDYYIETVDPIDSKPPKQNRFIYRFSDAAGRPIKAIHQEFCDSNYTYLDDGSIHDCAQTERGMDYRGAVFADNIVEALELAQKAIAQWPGPK